MKKILLTSCVCAILTIFLSLHVLAKCENDYDYDGDCDGLDLVVLISEFNPGFNVNALTSFTTDFGRTNCPTRIVGPMGGRLEFPNGVILDIPAGAVTEEIEIEVTDLTLDQIDSILSLKGFASHEKRCIGGFSAEPDGFVFNAPITAIVPVLPLNPSEIPVQIEVDLVEEKSQIVPTDLVYKGDLSVAEIKVSHFSPETIAGMTHEEFEKKCTSCQSWLDGDPVCENFDPYQSACCLLYPSVRKTCAPNCKCCKDDEIVVNSGEIDFASGQCQILNAELEIAFPKCPGSPTFESTISETSAECPENIEVEIIPSNPSIYICEEMTLEAKIISKDDEGNVVLNETIPAKEWKLLPEGSEVAEIHEVPPTTSVVLGLQEGTVEIHAQSPDPRFKGQTTLNVQKPDLDIIPEDGDFLMDVGDEETWDALCVTCPDGEVAWETNRPDVVELTELAGDAVRIRAIAKGAAEIKALFICGVPKPIEYVETVIVEQEVASVEIDPNMSKIFVDDTLTLTVTVKDKNGDIISNPDIEWTIPPGGIIAFDPITQVVRGVGEGTAEIIATCEGVSASATITVAGIYRITWNATMQPHSNFDSPSPYYTCTYDLLGGSFMGTAEIEYFGNIGDFLYNTNILSVSASGSLDFDKVEISYYTSYECKTEVNGRYIIADDNVYLIGFNISERADGSSYCNFNIDHSATSGGTVTYTGVGLYCAPEGTFDIYDHTDPYPFGGLCMRNDGLIIYIDIEADDPTGTSFSTNYTSVGTFYDNYRCGEEIVYKVIDWEVNIVKIR